MQTAECRMAIERLLAYLDAPNLRRAEAEVAINHIQGCPDCKRKVGHLISALATEETDSLTCEECLALLPGYMQAEIDKKAQEAYWRPVALHLKTCPHCSAEYAALSSLATLAYGEEGMEPPYEPVPDLSFLRKKKAGASPPVEIPWRLDALGRLVIQFSADLVQALRPPSDRLSYVRARAKSDKLSRVLYQLSLKEAVEDLEVMITATERRDDPTQCTIVVEANIPSRGGWPNLADTEVTLKRGDLELDTQLTDAFGQAVFEGIAADDLVVLVFEIAPPA